MRNKLIACIFVLITVFVFAMPASADEHWIWKNIDGEYIKLEDGSLWEVAPSDQVDTLLWLPADNITVIKSNNPFYPFLFINTDEKEKAEVKLLSL